MKKGYAKKGLNTYSLASIGIGSIIGGGFFLGSSLAISEAGPSILLAFLLGGFIMSQVLGAMTSISINRPVQGSFRVHSEEFLGKSVGFFLGWVFFISGILILGSEALATGIFFSYWAPHISPIILSLISLIIVIAINRLNIKFFGYVETLMTVLKIGMLIVFIITGLYFILNHWHIMNWSTFYKYNNFFPHQLWGFLQSMLVVIFIYGGIGTVAMAASEVEKPHEQIPKATTIMTVGIISLYVISMFIVISTVNWSTINTSISPFVQSLDKMNYNWGQNLVNATILIATLSVMIGTYYSCLEMLVSLSQANEASKVFNIQNKKGFYQNAWLMTAMGTLLIILISFIIGIKMFNYLISASSYFSLFNWAINLLTYLVWLKKKRKDEIYHSPLISGRLGAITTIILILFLTVLSLRVTDFRYGFYMSFVIMFFIYIFYKFKISKVK